MSLNLRDFLLNHGDQITINYAGHTIAVQIDNSGYEHHLLAFENEWGEFEIVETSGALTINSRTKKTTQIIAEDGKERSVIIDAPEYFEYTFNTGFINSSEEVVWLSKLLNAKQHFWYNKGVPVPIILKTTSLKVYSK